MSLNKFTKADDSFTVNMYDNGYMVDIGGRDSDGDWVRAKVVCNTIDQVVDLIHQIDTLPKD